MLYFLNEIRHFMLIFAIIFLTIIYEPIILLKKYNLIVFELNSLMIIIFIWFT